MITLYEGDCLDVLPSINSPIAPMLGRDPFRLVLTDPPYSRAGGAHTSRQDAAGRASEIRASDAFWGHWFTEVWRSVAAACSDEACALIFTDYRTIGALESAVAAAGVGWHVSQCAVWDRESIGLGSPMRASHELIAFARGPKFKWGGRRDIGNVFRCRWPYGKHEHHGAEKPVVLLRELIRAFSDGGALLDPFAGSGSALVASKEEGVSASGIERDHAHIQTARTRLGIKASLFAPTVMRRDDRGKMYLMNRATRGWGEYAVPVDCEAHVRAMYHADVGEWTEDEHGPYAPVTPMREVAS